MKTSLEHLPGLKRKELEYICEVIIEKMQPDFIILFGSYARGNWVDDEYTEDWIRYTYKRDYDILVITETKLTQELNDRWKEAEREVKSISKSAFANLIQHSHGYVKRELAFGSYFFTDIVKEGIVLYDNKRNYPLELPKVLDPEKVKQRAKEEYDLWFDSASTFLKTYRFNFSEGDYKIAAFLLHQATERFYMALLLVFTGYKPKIHDIEELGSQAEAISDDFKKVFPRNTPQNEERFILLKKAYIDARYKKSYSITKEELGYLNERVELLRDLVEKVCLERLGNNQKEA